MSQDDDYVQLGDFLRERGHTEAETVKIIARVRSTKRKRNCIGAGHLDLVSLINDALKEPDGS